MSTFCQVNVVYVSYGVDGVDGIETIVLYKKNCDALVTFSVQSRGVFTKQNVAPN